MSNKDIYSKLTEKIVALLDEGTVLWQRGWSTLSTDIPRNAGTGRAYSGGNLVIMSLWTMAKGYTQPLYLTMNQISEINEANSKRTQPIRLAVATSKLPAQFKLTLLQHAAQRFVHVKKGEGGYPVIYFKQLSFDDKSGQIDEQTGETMKVTRPFAEVYWVWNVDQIAGLTPDMLPVWQNAITNQPELKPFEPLALPQQILDTYAKELTGGLHYGGDSAYYRPGNDSIQLPLQGQFNGLAEFYMVAFHEIAHSTGAGFRLARDLSGSFMTEKYGKEELVAEMTAVFLASISGVDVPFENSAAYLAGWKKACSDDPQLIYQAAVRAQAAVEYILSIVGVSLNIETVESEGAIA